MRPLLTFEYTYTFALVGSDKAGCIVATEV